LKKIGIGDCSRIWTAFATANIILIPLGMQL